jgi:hypothetical protein
MNIKLVIGLIAVVLTFIGYAPYIRDIFKGKTKPHVFSWFIWGLDTAMVYALQVKAGAGFGSWVTLSITIILFFVFILGLKRGEKDIQAVDVIFLVLALIALGLWLIVKQPVLSIIILSAVEMSGFIPTIRKSWNAPYTETLSFYIITTIRHGLSILALSQYNIVTWLYPVTWTAANALFAILLFLRRKKINH